MTEEFYWMPSEDEIRPVANRIWEGNGGGITSKEEADENWFTAIRCLRERYHRHHDKRSDR